MLELENVSKWSGTTVTSITSRIQVMVERISSVEDITAGWSLGSA